MSRYIPHPPNFAEDPMYYIEPYLPTIIHYTIPTIAAIAILGVNGWYSEYDRFTTLFALIVMTVTITLITYWYLKKTNTQLRSVRGMLTVISGAFTYFIIGIIWGMIWIWTYYSLDEGKKEIAEYIVEILKHNSTTTAWAISQYIFYQKIHFIVWNSMIWPLSIVSFGCRCSREFVVNFIQNVINFIKNIWNGCINAMCDWYMELIEKRVKEYVTFYNIKLSRMQI